jgi:DNA recombination protein RmuC
MVDYVDFDEQLTVISDDERLRPDMVIKLTQGGQIAVDSKVPLDGYLDSVALQGPERDTAMEKVAKQIRTHIKQLSEKEYWRELDNSANFTVMFIPIEGAFQEAVGVDTGLVEYAANQKIAIATPFTLLGMLHTIARLETQFQIAQKIDSYLQEARKLHKRAIVFADHLGKAQRSVTSATKHIDSAARSFDRMFMKSIEDMNSRAIASGIDEPENDPMLEIPAADYDED